MPAPSVPVYRVSRTFDPFQAPDWIYVRPDGTFGNRFDDPRKKDGLRQSERFRTIYCADTHAGAYGETTSRLRRDLRTIAGLAAIDPDEPLDAAEYSGVITFEWRLKRRVGTLWLYDSLPLVDLVAHQTLHALRSDKTIVGLADELGFDEIDVSTVTGATKRHRPLTQQIAAHVYMQRDESGNPQFAGIHYPSRLNPKWKIFAVFDDRAPEPRRSSSHVIRSDDPALREIADLFSLAIE